MKKHVIGLVAVLLAPGNLAAAQLGENGPPKENYPPAPLPPAPIPVSQASGETKGGAPVSIAPALGVSRSGRAPLPLSPTVGQTGTSLPPPVGQPGGPAPSPPAPAVGQNPGTAPLALSPALGEKGPGDPPGAVSLSEPARDRQYLWVSGEYLLWWIKDAQVPPVAFTGPFPNLPPLNPGVALGPSGLPGLTQPHSLALFGSSEVDGEEHSGGRFSAGYWFDDERIFGLEASYFFLGARSARGAVELGGNVDPLTLPPFVLRPGTTPGSGGGGSGGGGSGGGGGIIGSGSGSGGGGSGGGCDGGHGHGHGGGGDDGGGGSGGGCDGGHGHHGHGGGGDDGGGGSGGGCDGGHGHDDQGGGDDHGGDGHDHDHGNCHLPRHGAGHDDEGEDDHGHDQGHGNGSGPRSATPSTGSTSGSSQQLVPAVTPAVTLPGGTVTSGFPGAIRSSLFTRLQGAELNGTLNISRGPGYSFDLLGGFLWLNLDEGLDIFESDTANLSATGVNGQPNGVTSSVLVTNLVRQEEFHTHNNFYGGDLAARLEWNRYRVFVNVLGKLGLGAVHEEVTINGTASAAGNLSLTGPNGTQTTSFSGPAPGWLAQSSNIGHYGRDRFAVVPEATVRLGYELTRNLRASLGYTFLYCSEVARPGDQIDPVQGPGHPQFFLRSNDFWAQGVDAQVEFTY